MNEPDRRYPRHRYVGTGGHDDRSVDRGQRKEGGKEMKTYKPKQRMVHAAYIDFANNIMPIIDAHNNKMKKIDSDRIVKCTMIVETFGTKMVVTEIEVTDCIGTILKGHTGDYLVLEEWFDGSPRLSIVSDDVFENMYEPSALDEYFEDDTKEEKE